MRGLCPARTGKGTGARGAYAHLAALLELVEDERQAAVLAQVVVELAELEIGLEPQALVVGLLERIERRLVDLLQEAHVLRGGDEVEDLVDHLLGVVARHRRCDVREHLAVGLEHQPVCFELELQLHDLLERLEAPFALLLLHPNHLAEAGERLVGIRVDEALRVVVLVLYVDVLLLGLLIRVLEAVVLLVRHCREPEAPRRFL
jgi:hypothetical protein